jgi:hypothetical protein
MWRLAFYILALLFMTACTTNSYNPSTYPYQYNSVLAQKPVKQVMILPINFNKPSRHYLEKYEAPIDEYVKSYLKNAEYTVMANKTFQAIWRKALLEFGNVYNPTTGEMTSAFKPALESALKNLYQQNPLLDAVIFTDLIETPVHYRNSSSRIAEWNGVRRKIKVEGIDDALTEEFNWTQTVDGISIGIHVFNRDQQLIQHSIGGIQTAQALKMSNKNARFSRRNDLLIDEDEINEGVQLGFHPFIIMKKYPGRSSEE